MHLCKHDVTINKTLFYTIVFEYITKSMQSRRLSCVVQYANVIVHQQTQLII